MYRPSIAYGWCRPCNNNRLRRWCSQQLLYRRPMFCMYRQRIAYGWCRPCSNSRLRSQYRPCYLCWYCMYRPGKSSSPKKFLLLSWLRPYRQGKPCGLCRPCSNNRRRSQSRLSCLVWCCMYRLRKLCKHRHLRQSTYLRRMVCRWLKHSHWSLQSMYRPYKPCGSYRPCTNSPHRSLSNLRYLCCCCNNRPNKSYMLRHLLRNNNLLRTVHKHLFGFLLS